jgi:hypothetical protein
MELVGFHIAMTGGGCTAFCYEFGNGRYLLITDRDGTSEPESLDVPIYVGLYSHDADSDFEEVHEMEKLAEFLEVW